MYFCGMPRAWLLNLIKKEKKNNTIIHKTNKKDYLSSILRTLGFNKNYAKNIYV